jgi:hypothetical protein
MPDLREASGVDAPIRMGDLEALFHRFSLQQEEGQREVKEYTQRLEARLTSLEHRSHAPSSDSFNGALATTGTNRVMRPRAAGGFPPSAPVVLPEFDEGSIARSDSTGAAPQEEENADDEADDPKTKKKPKYHTAIQVCQDDYSVPPPLIPVTEIHHYHVPRCMWCAGAKLA